jgi:hypothetical protein
MRLIGGIGAPRVWVETDKVPTRICFGFALLRFVLDIGEAVALATALVAAVDEVRADHHHETG